MDVVTNSMEHPKLTKQPSIVGFLKRPRLEEVHKEFVNSMLSKFVANNEVICIFSEIIAG
jgi:hypothetical protein